MPSEKPASQAIMRARDDASAYANQIGRMLLAAAEAAFEAQRAAHEVPLAFSFDAAIKRAREAADWAVKLDGKIDRTTLCADIVWPDSAAQPAGGRDGE